ncbi:hypothetical protein QE364_002419 [Nocardioides zeae]|uniref:Uncharacterized protein n=1 Tax=Nocardioides zeae TaxID=1457234 RepID=A0ACC6IJ32_9ACTN|nr:DUF4247 domain-containing protein [Nocardioides zeae]MDR6174634.1 hypothetical protein [Nocardioides zeae]MDR6210704.1 hypothetical protein [Nocardioides zeae]
MSSRAKGLLVIGVLLLVGIIVVPFAFGGFGNGPKGWIDDHYTHVSGSDPDTETVTWRSDDDVTTTAAAIASGTDASDRREADGRAFLRYSNDWIVTVAEDGDGSRITLDEFDRGYSANSTFVGFWGGYYGGGGGGGSSYRGGGSGSGK